MELSHSECTTFSSQDKEALTSQYYVYHTIGSGTFGHVKKACHHLTDKEVAVKILQTRDYPILVENEVDIVKSLSHPHLIRVYQVIQEEEHTYLGIEMATKGNLQTWIQNSHCLFENEARKLLQQIASAVQYCHLKWIAHLDLKPDNILHDEYGNAKVSDFGLSVRVAPGQLLTEVRGAYVFRAPEIYLKQAYDGFKVDVWCLSTILLFMVTGQFPFQGSNSNQLREAILHGRYEIPFHLSAKGQSIISQFLTLNPEYRPNIQQVMVHPWLAPIEEGSLYRDEPLPNHLDPLVVTIMCDMGYTERQIHESVIQSTFDAVMATYLLLQSDFKSDSPSWKGAVAVGSLEILFPGTHLDGLCCLIPLQVRCPGAVVQVSEDKFPVAAQSNEKLILPLDLAPTSFST
ncbi:sperm motility kinase Z-like [Perognathus longimembris pacificus]|uniref:sperm motility kinase Z-like n=1 Tax=Perognathus longimembris pacificus TaxID=214514 RepID=UPI002018C612|nr:sperm motility kinase Z-like [Perognathus longimembris pacificus]